MTSRPAEKIARTGIERRHDTMYFIKNGDVWGVLRKVPGEPMSTPMLIAEAGVEMDFRRYLYYVDAEGDIARKERYIAPPRKKAAKKKKKKAAKKKKKKGAKKKKKVAKKKIAKKKTTSRRE